VHVDFFIFRGRRREEGALAIRSIPPSPCADRSKKKEKEQNQIHLLTEGKREEKGLQTPSMLTDLLTFVKKKRGERTESASPTHLQFFREEK